MAKNNINLTDLINQEEELEPETITALFPQVETFDRQKVLVLRLLKHTRAPYEDFDVFENCVHVLNGIEPSVYAREGSEPEEIWKALQRIERLFPDGDKPELSDEVKIYIKAVHYHRGYQFFPPGWDIENPKLKEVQKRAQQPGKLGEDPLDIQAARYLRIQKYLNK